ncbi:MAG: DNA polymerase III subunit delta [Prevotella sp.]|nr:DNA polymerase III subunit delta [Prevotella sp.]
MAKKQGSSFEAIMSDIRARKFAPVYILMGEESYFIDCICDALAATVLPEEEREFNQFVVYGIDVTAAQIADMARELPMMSEYKVIIVKEAQNLKSIDDLERYLDRPSPQTILVFCHKNGNIDGRKKFLPKARVAGIVFESAKVKDEQLPAFVDTFVRERGKTIDRRTAEIIAEAIGSDLCRLASELDKLCVAMGEEAVITGQLVEQHIGVSRDYNTLEFRNAIVRKDYAKAAKILDYFDKNPRSGGPFILVPTMFSFFQTLIIAHYGPDKNNPNILARHLGLWPRAAEEFIAAMRNYSAVKTMQIISKIRETDEKMKGLNSTGSTSAGDLAKELLFFAFH